MGLDQFSLGVIAEAGVFAAQYQLDLRLKELGHTKICCPRVFIVENAPVMASSEDANLRSSSARHISTDAKYVSLLVASFDRRPRRFIGRVNVNVFSLRSVIMASESCPQSPQSALLISRISRNRLGSFQA